MGKHPSKILLLDMDSEVTRTLCRRLLQKGFQVVSVGKSETKLGDLKSFEKFTFYRLDLSSKDIVRSYIYEVDTVIFFDHSDRILEKINNFYQSIIYLKFKTPRIFFISTCHVFSWKPNKLWLEEEDLNPDSDFGELISGAETMIRNYAEKLSSPACIIRIPRFVDSTYVEPNFIRFIRILKNHEKIDFDISSNLVVQFINMDNLLESLYRLFEMQWDGVETIHVDSFHQNFIPLLDSLRTVLPSKSSLLKDNKLIAYIKELLMVSPLVRKRLDILQKVHTVDFLRQPILDSKKSQRLFNLKRLKLQNLITNLPIK